MSKLTDRIKRLSKEITTEGQENRKMFKMMKQAYYSASDEGKEKMVAQWDKDGL